MDKNKAVVEYLFECPYIKGSPLFFNFGKAEDNNSQISVTASDVSVNTPFIDGSVRKRYTFTLIIYKSVAYRAVIDGKEDENMDDVLDVQSVLDWVNEQDEERNYPDFGEFCIIDRIQALTDQPNLNSVDVSSTPALAKYSISIRIEYIDTSKVIWNKKGE